MIVADASPLIVLAKLQRLELLNDLYGEVLLGPTVKAETIDAGEAVRTLGVEQLEVALEDGWLQTVHLTAEERGLMQRLSRRSRLDQGEAEAKWMQARVRNGSTAWLSRKIRPDEGQEND